MSILLGSLVENEREISLDRPSGGHYRGDTDNLYIEKAPWTRRSLGGSKMGGMLRELPTRRLVIKT